MRAQEPIAIAGLRVLELADERAVFAGRLLADLGADVVRIEPPDGGRVRQLGPFLGGKPGIERGLVHLYHNANKRSVVLDLEVGSQREEFRRLGETADVVLVTESPGEMAERGLGYQDLRAGNPRIVYVSVTPFGPDGSWMQRATSDLVAAAAGGLLYISGDPERPPTRAPGNQSYVMASLLAVTGALIALVGRDRGSGRGRQVDVSVQEAVAMTVLQTANANLYRLDGRVPGRPGISPPLYRCADGRWVGLRVRPDRFEQVIDWARRHQAVDAAAAYDLESLRGGPARGDLNASETMRGVIAAIAARCTADELLEQAWEIDLIALPVSRLEDMRGMEHYIATHQFVDVPQLDSVTLPFPRSAFDGWSPGAPIRRAPRLGEHTDEILSGLEARIRG